MDDARLKRDFYAEMCRVANTLSVRTASARKFNGYAVRAERVFWRKKPARYLCPPGIDDDCRRVDQLSLDLFFREPYVLEQNATQRLLQRAYGSSRLFILRELDVFHSWNMGTGLLRSVGRQATHHNRCRYRQDHYHRQAEEMDRSLNRIVTAIDLELC